MEQQLYNDLQNITFTLIYINFFCYLYYVFKIVKNNFFISYQLEDDINDFVSLKNAYQETEEDKLLKEKNDPHEIKYENKYLEKLRNNTNYDVSILTDDQLNHFDKNIIFEKTPIGNVAMFYDHKTTTFTYYSDNTIPYRFLEVVARKYVLAYNCKQIYIDMEEELKKIEEKQNIIDNGDNSEDTEDTIQTKKSVFAKFKSYNKESGSGRVQTVPPPKNSIPHLNKNVITNSTNHSEKMLLKDNANRYLCKGRFSNFNILQKVDRKKVDQKYALTFADFKKIKNL